MILAMYSNFSPDVAHLRRLEDLSGLSVVVADDETKARAHAAETTIWLGHRYLRQIWPLRRELKWLQVTSGGLDPLARLEGISAGSTPCITRCTVHGDVIAHHALALAWRLWRRLDESPPLRQGARASVPSFWPRVPTTALVLGLGTIGRQLAGMLAALGIKVWGVSRMPPEDASKLPAACQWLGPGDWRGHLGQFDLLFVCLPPPASGQPYLGAAEIAAMSPQTMIVSISRPETIDRVALVAALRENRLGGAALDIVVPAEETAVWHAPHLFITPKTAAMHGGFQERVQAFVEAQMARHIANQPLLDCIDTSRL